MLVGRLDGPLHFRLIAQPCIAAILAVRVAMRDAREGRPPYFFLPALGNMALRRELLGIAFKDVKKVFIVACILDVAYGLILYHWIYPLQTLFVSVVLALLPYLVVRGPATRIASHFFSHGKAVAHHG